MTTRQPSRAQTAREERIGTFADAVEKAREVLRERGLTPEQIEAQLNKPKRDDL